MAMSEYEDRCHLAWSAQLPAFTARNMTMEGGQDYSETLALGADPCSPSPGVSGSAGTNLETVGIGPAETLSHSNE